MKGYKAFHKGLICNGKQYAENTVFEDTGASECCQAGVMHFCETPFDVLDYYPLVDENGEFSEFAEVEALDEVLVKENKRATKKMRIGAKLSIRDFIRAEVSVVIESTKQQGDTNLTDNGGDGAQIGSSGDGAKINMTGTDSVGAAIGYNSRAKGKAGNWIVLAEWKRHAGGNWYPACVKTGLIDGNALMPDTWYTLRDGEFVEATDDD